MTESSFNWITALEGAIRTEPSDVEWYRMENLAGTWPTCACGELCRQLPRCTDGSPRDEALYGLGRSFYNNVLGRDWPAALAIFRQIEARTEQLLKEQEGK